MRKKPARAIKATFISLFLIICISFSAANISRLLMPHTVSGYILYAKTDETGATKTELRKSDGIAAALGKVLYVTLGADFFNDGIGKSVSGNIIYDIETPTVIDEDNKTGGNASPQTAQTPPENTDSIPQKSASILEKNISSSGGRTKIDEKISINNETSYTIDPSELTSEKAPFSVSKNAKVLIYHTHTTESYQPDSEHDFSHTTPDRTTDTAYNVASVGDVLARELESLGIGVIHIKDLYDHPQYNNSYARSCEAVQAVLAENPDIKIAIDLHRDAITTKEGQKTKITADINGEKVAQVMLVVGTDELGLAHENWRTNLKFAASLQRRFLEISPDFVRPLNLRTSRFNGHVAPGAVIIEVGAAGNTLCEAKASAPYIAKALKQVIDDYS